ncbi:wee1-like protein kinase 2 [Octopus sinensis]|uniref:Wee1-like protein kinase n=1 Tax=Octopus sinensis TaxID=2607531 RepID=A0A6P7UAV1_9MOLL|nr:wee1-like protein kinase 2 [Octopus sinensis]
MPLTSQGKPVSRRCFSRANGTALRTTLDFNSSGSAEDMMEDEDEEDSLPTKHDKRHEDADNRSFLRISLDLYNDSAIVADLLEEDDDVMATNLPSQTPNRKIFNTSHNSPFRWRRAVTTGGRITRSKIESGGAIPFNPEMEISAIVDFNSSQESGLSTPQLDTSGCDTPSRQMSPLNHKSTPATQSPPEMLSCLSPPHRKFRALRLFDTPHTPQTLLLNVRKKDKYAGDRTKVKCLRKKKIERLEANINPFTTSITCRASGEKRTRSQSDKYCDILNVVEEIDCPQPKKLALREISTSRYKEEFFEVCKLGDGEFGSAYKCVNRLDGCIYAIKKSKMPVAGSQYERVALNEVYAHAVLGQHRHVVRYYSAWAEDDHMYIQNEFCNGGNLAEAVQKPASQRNLKHIIFQIANGLKYIHSKGLVHLDIKPGNIFVHKEETVESGTESCSEDDPDFSPQITYKIGDLGHVTKVSNPRVEEGDCHYLPKEILAEDFRNLYKADIFSLGLTAYEMGGGGPLPKNGDLWHSIREDGLPYLSHYSAEFNKLLNTMVHVNAEYRPTAFALTKSQVLCPQAMKTKTQLCKELNEEKLRNRLLSKQLESKKCCCKIPTDNCLGQKCKSSRLIGHGIKRSYSLSDI